MGCEAVKPEVGAYKASVRHCDGQSCRSDRRYRRHQQCRRSAIGDRQESREITPMTRPVLDDPHSSTAPSAVNATREPTSDLRAMVTLALPVVVAQVGLMAMGAVDTVMVGHISAHVLAAVALGNLYFFNAIVLSQGTLLALDPIVAQAIGARDDAAISRAVQRGIIIAMLLSVVTALILLPVRTVLVLTHQQPEIITDTTNYVWVSIP